MTTTPQEEFIWGAEAIATAIGRPGETKAVFHALATGRIPGAKKIAGRWCLKLSMFVAAFEENGSA